MGNTDTTMNLLDRYYMALYRIWNGRLSYRYTGTMTMIALFGLWGICLLFFPRYTMSFLREYFIIFIGILAIFVVGGNIILDLRYNKRRREKLVKTFENESQETRDNWTGWAVFYMIASVLLFLFSAWRAIRFTAPPSAITTTSLFGSLMPEGRPCTNGFCRRNEAMPSGTSYFHPIRPSMLRVVSSNRSKEAVQFGKSRSIQPITVIIWRCRSRTTRMFQQMGSW